MMKAISLKQPWAWLVCAGYKPIEFRWWKSSVRGEIYIHASKSFDYQGYNWLLAHPELPGVNRVREIKWHPKTDPDFGAIIGKAKVINCIDIKEAEILYPDDMWLTVSKGGLGNKCYILRDSMLFEHGDFIPCRGWPGFFEPNMIEKEKEVNGN